ncbi:hypothetical protein [Fulvivirga sediminis]|uniref:Uncharacterized protein n=1 Tax=Fulvivirga sediminis TaxID=2803949 RepID=A0A937JZR6_9BACT|nr:hypothetical protein [Fulvivirga sediminis]MBL3656919.1 hypothetical protein [Fulvivirga sediminis]
MNNPSFVLHKTTLLNSEKLHKELSGYLNKKYGDIDPVSLIDGPSNLSGGYAEIVNFDIVDAQINFVRNFLPGQFSEYACNIDLSIHFELFRNNEIQGTLSDAEYSYEDTKSLDTTIEVHIRVGSNGIIPDIYLK